MKADDASREENLRRKPKDELFQFFNAL